VIISHPFHLTHEGDAQKYNDPDMVEIIYTRDDSNTNSNSNNEHYHMDEVNSISRKSMQVKCLLCLANLCKPPQNVKK
jgi:hypothetical protein